MILEGCMFFKSSGSKKTMELEIKHYLLQGWKVRQMESKRCWPKVWQFTYTITFYKDIICDQKHIIETPLTELI